MSSATDVTSDERKFLHELGNAIAVASGQVMLAVKKIKKPPGEVNLEEVQTKLDSAQAAMTRLVELIHKRREFLHASAGSEAKTAG